MKSMQLKLISLLRWSEKYTKTDMVYLFNSSSWVLVGQILTTVSAFIVLVFLANLLSKEQLGDYRFITAAVLVLSIFCLPGSNGAIPQSMGKGYSGDLKKITLLRIKYGLAASAVSFCIALYYLFFDKNEVLGYSFILLSAFMPFYNVFFNFYPYFQGKQDFRKSTLLHIPGRVFFTILIILSAFFSQDIVFLTLIFLLGSIIPQYIAYKYAVNDEKKIQTHKNDPHIQSYSIYLTAVGAPSMLAAHLDKIIIGFILGPVQLAIYFVATSFAMESSRVGRILAQAILPRLSEKKTIDSASFLYKILLMEIILLLLFFVYYFIAPFFFSLFFPDYLDAVNLSRIAMLALLFSPIYVIRSFLVANKRKQELNILLIGIPIIQILLLIGGVLLYSLLGAILAMLVGLLLEFLVGIYFLTKKK